MSKRIRFSAEEKFRIVESYRSGKEGAMTIVSKYDVPKSTLRDWVRLYETRGTEGLMSYSKSRKYTQETKLAAVREYLDGKGSQADVCRKYDISTSSMLRQWIKWYNNHGDFKQRSNWSEFHMVKGRKVTLEERKEIVADCIASNKDYAKMVEQYGVSYNQVYTWVRKYEKEGSDSFKDRRGKRKPQSKMTEVEKLRAEIKLKEAENRRLQMENDVLKKLEEIERGRSRH